MTFVEILHVLSLYKADVLLLAIGVCFVSKLLEKTLLKRLPDKLRFALPFVLGVLFYGSYRAIVTLGFSSFAEEVARTAEGGFACGFASTLCYAVWTQIVQRGKKKAEPLEELLSGIAEGEEKTRLAEELRTGSDGLEGEQLCAFVRTVLSEAAPELEPVELEIHVRLISDFLTALRT